MLIEFLSQIWRVYFVHSFIEMMEGMDDTLENEETASRTTGRNQVRADLCDDMGIDVSDLALVKMASLEDVEDLMQKLANKDVEDLMQNLANKGGNSGTQPSSSTK